MRGFLKVFDLSKPITVFDCALALPREPDGSCHYVSLFLCFDAFLSSLQMWEKAIELGKQLAKMHESQMFDFMELSQLLV